MPGSGGMREAAGGSRAAEDDWPSLLLLLPAVGVEGRAWKRSMISCTSSWPAAAVAVLMLSRPQPGWQAVVESTDKAARADKMKTAAVPNGWRSSLLCAWCRLDGLPATASSGGRWQRCVACEM